MHHGIYEIPPFNKKGTFLCGQACPIFKPNKIYRIIWTKFDVVVKPLETNIILVTGCFVGVVVGRIKKRKFIRKC